MKHCKLLTQIIAIALCAFSLAGCDEGERSTKMTFTLDISSSMAYYVNPVVKITDESGVVEETTLHGTNMSVGTAEYVYNGVKEGSRSWTYTYQKADWNHKVKLEISLQPREGANLDNKEKEVLAADVTYIVKPYKGNTTSTLVLNAEADEWVNCLCEPGQAATLVPRFTSKPLVVEIDVDAAGQVDIK